MIKPRLPPQIPVPLPILDSSIALSLAKLSTTIAGLVSTFRLIRSYKITALEKEVVRLTPELNSAQSEL
jgi:hypothetical protein